MRQWCLLMILGVLSCCATSCTPLHLQRVKEGLEETISQLPQSDGFTIVAILSGEFYDTYGEVTCYSAGANIAVGSSLATGNAWEIYVNELQSQGWALERDDMKRTKVLVRGQNERVAVRSGPPGWEMELEESYKRAQTVYPSFVYLIVDYYLPSRDECLGTADYDSMTFIKAQVWP